MDTPTGNKDISELSDHLFWDVQRTKLDPQKNKKLIIHRVLDYGLMQDWKFITMYYGLDNILNTARQIRDLDPKTASFLAHLSNTSVSDFLCYTTKQSTKQHWNF